MANLDKSLYATGIHLHLGMRDLYILSENQIKNISWSALRSCPYIDFLIITEQTVKAFQTKQELEVNGSIIAQSLLLNTYVSKYLYKI